MQFSVKFKGHENIGNHTEYLLEVSNKSTGELWKLQQRYSALLEVYSHIKKTFPVPLKFPPKKVFGNKNPKFLEQRQAGLEAYFTELLKVPEVLENPFCKRFFTPQDKLVTSAAPVKAKVAVPIEQSSDKAVARQVSVKAMDLLTGKLFDLSTQPAPLEEDEVKKQAKVYIAFCKDLKLNLTEGLPNRSDLNHTYYTLPIRTEEFLEKTLAKVSSIMALPQIPVLTRHLD